MRIKMEERKTKKWATWKCIVIRWAKLVKFWSILLILLCSIMIKLMEMNIGIKKILINRLEGSMKN